MLVIRKEQMQALRDAARAGFVRRMVRHLRINFPAQTQIYSDAELRRMIETQLLVAESCSLRLELTTCRFLELSVLYGWGFGASDRYQWVADKLRDISINEKIRMDEVEQYLCGARAPM